ncbi:MAG: hypothetical protein LC720_09415, partial [Actinobacteria bacterium]|nr:hypothetical protein [Actinomycetota bacterium]
GTIDYVAPEQARGDRVDARTDVYSLGCVLFHALTGTVPYPLDSDLAKLYAHDSRPPPSVLERAPDLAATFEPVLARAMAKAPADRYPSAGDLGRAAVAAAAGASTSQAERSVAVGAAAGDAAPARASPPPPITGPTDPSPRAGEPPPVAPVEPPTGRRRRLVVGGALGAIAIAGAIVAILGGGGGSGPAPVTVITQNPGPAVVPPPVRGLREVAVRQTTAPGGYRYRLALAMVRAPPGASVGTPVAYYLTLAVARGGQPLVTVERLRVPYAFTASSVVADFSVGPDPDGTSNAALSWYVRQGDATDVTHYFTLAPNRINVD